jgi:hypothetical protein
MPGMPTMRTAQRLVDGSFCMTILCLAGLRKTTEKQRLDVEGRITTIQRTQRLRIGCDPLLAVRAQRHDPLHGNDPGQAGELLTGGPKIVELPGHVRPGQDGIQLR